MLIWLQQLAVQLFLWLLKMADGVMEIFAAIAGIADVNYKGCRVNIIEFVAADSTVGTVFWCIFILAAGLACLFAVVALIKNMIQNRRRLSEILGKAFLGVAGSLAMLAAVILFILISNAVLRLISEIFRTENTAKISGALFNACAGRWQNGYSVREFDIDSVTVTDILGNYEYGWIFPDVWKYDGMVDPDAFLYFPSLIIGGVLIFALLSAGLSLARRVYEIVFLYLVMPVSLSTLSLDDGGRFRTWRETFVAKMLSAYGTVLSVNVFALILPIITNMHIDGIGGFGNAMFTIFMIAGGALAIPAGQRLFAKLAGDTGDGFSGNAIMMGAFHRGKIAGAMALGASMRMARGGIMLGRGIASRMADRGDGGDRYGDGQNGENAEEE